MNKNVPSVVLTNLRVNNAPVTPSEDGPIKQSILLSDRIDLKHKDNFSISFVALNYTISEQNRYEYRLNGVDKEWVQAGKEHTAYYTNLDPGDYVFQVRASNNDGVWNKKGHSIAIHVSPPFWRSIYAYIFYVYNVPSRKMKSQLLFLHLAKIQQLVHQVHQTTPVALYHIKLYGIGRLFDFIN